MLLLLCTSRMDNECSIDMIWQISSLDFDWKVVGRRLLNNQWVENLDREEKGEQNKRELMLYHWQQQKHSKATYRCIVDVLKGLKYMKAADEVEMLSKGNWGKKIKMCILFRTLGRR